jgi:Domain of unknown function (DUF5615)
MCGMRLTVRRDPGLPRFAVGRLRDMGWDVMHVADIGMSRALDSEILEHARLEKVWPMIQEDLDHGATAAITERSSEVRGSGLP